MASLKRERLSFSNKYKAITEVDSGRKPLKTTEKCGAPKIQDQHACCLEIKKNIKVLFNLEYN